VPNELVNCILVTSGSHTSATTESPTTAHRLSSVHCPVHRQVHAVHGVTSRTTAVCQHCQFTYLGLMVDVMTWRHIRRWRAAVEVIYYYPILWRCNQKV